MKKLTTYLNYTRNTTGGTYLEVEAHVHAYLDDELVEQAARDLVAFIQNWSTA